MSDNVSSTNADSIDADSIEADSTNADSIDADSIDASTTNQETSDTNESNPETPITKPLGSKTPSSKTPGVESFFQRVRKRRPSKRIVLLALVLAAPTALYLDANSNRCSDSVTISSSSANSKAGSVFFPTISAKTLANRCVTFPKETQGKVGVLFVAFEQGAQSEIDTWVDPVINNYLNDDRVSYYEIPMISGAYKPVSRFIDGGMRGGVPSKLHDRTATFYGKRSAFFSSMNISNRTHAYLFVLSREGRIVFRSSGSASAEQVADTIEAIEGELKTIN
jgi:ATP10 protein